MTEPRVFLREFARDRAERVVDTPGGFAVLSPARYPHAHDHNALWVFRPVDAADLLAAADETLGPFAHRRIEVTPDVLTDDLARALATAGYEREDNVLMTQLRPPAADRPPVGYVALLSVEQRVDIADRVWSEEDPPPPPGVRRELAERVNSATNAAQCSFLAIVGAGGGIEASCDLFVRGAVAQVEEVSTLTAFRGRGHASRLVRAATERARADAPDRTVFLVADGDDWPKDLYARLGFEITDRTTVWGRVSAP